MKKLINKMVHKYLQFLANNPEVKYPGKFDPSKSVILSDETGKFVSLSTEEMMAKKLNNFQGWKCSAGSEALHIGQEGEILLAACAIHGVHGNVYSGDINLPENWVTCDQRACMCGGDMQLRKTRDDSFIAESLNPKLITMKPVDEVENPAWAGPYQFPKAKDHFVTVSWDMGKRCNYACSYCPPEVSNKTDPLKTWDELKRATDNIIALRGQKNKIKWVITGGEPTIIPDYMKWVEYVHQMGHTIHTTTNGSRGGKYLEELIQYSNVGISVHLEFLDINRLEETVRRVVEMKSKNLSALGRWFGVRVMVAPGFLAQAELVKVTLEAIPGFKENAHFFLSALHHYEKDANGRANFGELLDYTPDEMSKLQELH